MELKEFKVIPVVVLNNEEDAVNQLTALREGGLLVAEITFRTAYALEGIKYAIKNFPDILVGAGTVINEKQAQEAIKAGVKFIVSPGLSKDVAKVCKENGIVYIPGCVTPTEIMEALDLGINTVKFFPANVYGGIKALKALSAPFITIKFIPTGGVNEENLREFLSFSAIEACGGSWMMKGSKEEMIEKIQKVVEIVEEFKK